MYLGVFVTQETFLHLSGNYRSSKLYEVRDIYQGAWQRVVVGGGEER